MGDVTGNYKRNVKPLNNNERQQMEFLEWKNATSEIKKLLNSINSRSNNGRKLCSISLSMLNIYLSKLKISHRKDKTITEPQNLAQYQMV